VFDDDPTGTQTVSDVDVLLRPTRRRLAAFLAGDEPALYVLTNTRALSRSKAVALVRSLHAVVQSEAARLGRRVSVVLRGDSTLRGHVFAEIDAIAAPDSVTLFVPAFPEGGRVTRHGVHFLIEHGRSRPVNETEFARDPVFGYQSRTLVDWVQEMGGRHAVSISLDALRETSGEAVSGALRSSPPRTVVVPDAESTDDLRLTLQGLQTAEDNGARVVVRAASSFAALRAGLQARALSTVVVPWPGRVLIVCGSHTEASRRQLESLAKAGVGILELPTAVAMAHDPSLALLALVERARDGLDADGVIVVASERTRHAAHIDLLAGARVMNALVSIVVRLRGRFDGLVAKGGITSADIASRGVGVPSARVLGQVRPGVPVWRMRSGSTTLPYVVVPGNVGADNTLVKVLAALGVEMPKGPRRFWATNSRSTMRSGHGSRPVGRATNGDEGEGP